MDTPTASPSLDNITNLIKNSQATRVVVLTGAGISTSAGIPDFRSPSTGLYAKLARLKHLPYPEAIFSYHYFKHSPELFYAIADAHHPRNLKPTISHAFLALLAKKNLLHMIITQNIDGLESAAGVPPEKIFACHGSWDTQRCIACKKPFPGDRMKEAIAQGTVPKCLATDGCGGVVKPDIVLFGEPLCEGFEEKGEHKVAEADLVLVMGTSLKVHPFARLPSLARAGVPRVLINREKVGDMGNRKEDMCLLGDCDGEVEKLADALGWKKELEILWEKAKVEHGEGSETDCQDHNAQLDAAIDKLSGMLDESLNISKGHKSMLERHLTEKLARLPRPADRDEK
ncbi:SIR2 family histone deacetylase [Paecilomyces variotii No. 5]|uniref:NAD-dependent protein deacetylase n=1 Tax=Byssochlamys spectabilis (strain No. 5 / NBRC 109023) TaxID=1356009 RepID=V5G1Q8_BYSSN|nr:SIR2 family histone deacetylase [Paecilomyces variotii No. 5]